MKHSFSMLSDHLALAGSPGGSCSSKSWLQSEIDFQKAGLWLGMRTGMGFVLYPLLVQLDLWG